MKDYSHANHNPALVVNGKAGTGPIEIDVATDETITLDATPEQRPRWAKAAYKWCVYPEAGLNGMHAADIAIADQDQAQAQVTEIAVQPLMDSRYDSMPRRGRVPHHP